MPRQNIRIFLSSPSDVAEERRRIKETIDKLQHQSPFYNLVEFEIVAWDQPGGAPLLAHLTPQDAINLGMPRPSECDLVIVLFWSRMGTPLPRSVHKPDGNIFYSGTEWEFWDAQQAAVKAGRPEILLYRRVPGPSVSQDEANSEDKSLQYQRVQDFFAALTNSAMGFASGGFNSYRTPEELSQLLERHLNNVLNRILEIKTRSQIRRLLLMYHKNDAIVAKERALLQLASVGEAAQETLLEIRSELSKAASVSYYDKELLKLLNFILLMDFPAVFSQILEELEKTQASADLERVIEVAVRLFGVNDQRVQEQLGGCPRMPEKS